MPSSWKAAYQWKSSGGIFIAAAMSLIRRLWRQNGPLSIPQDRKGCALDLPLPVREWLILHALCKGVPADFCCGFRLDLRLCPLGRCLCVVSRLFAVALVPALQRRLSGKRSTSNRSEKNSNIWPLKNDMTLAVRGQGASAPCVLLGFQRGGSLRQRITPLMEAALDVRTFDDQPCHASLSNSRSFCSNRS